MRSPVRRSPPVGPFAAGLAQTLAVWLLALAGLVTVRSRGGDGPSWHYSATVLWVALGTALATCLALYAGHRRRGRHRTATGVRIGALAWPAALLVAFLAVSVVAMAVTE